MLQRPSATPKREQRYCWKAPDLSDVVMFHGYHDYEFIAHSHDVLTVILVTEGAVRIDIDGESYRVGAGNLVMIGAHQIHSARPASPRGWGMRSLHLPPSALSALPHLWLDETSPVTFGNPVHEHPGPARSFFLDWHYYSELRGQDHRQRVHFERFVAWLQENLQDFAPRLSPGRPADPLVLRAREIIMATVFENRPIESIAAEIGLSTYTLIRRFKQAFGISPHAWRIQARANAATRMLRAGKPLVDVAASCGFSDQAHMARVFRRVFGVTPSQYEAMLRDA